MKKLIIILIAAMSFGAASAQSRNDSYQKQDRRQVTQRDSRNYNDQNRLNDYAYNNNNQWKNDRDSRQVTQKDSRSYNKDQQRSNDYAYNNNNQWKNDRDSRQVTQKDNRSYNNDQQRSNDYAYNNNNQWKNDRDRQAAYDRMNNQYDQRINGYKNDRSLSPYERSRRIRGAEQERQQQSKSFGTGAIIGGIAGLLLGVLISHK